MKYVISPIEQGGYLKIALDAKADDYEPASDEMEISETEVARHIHAEYIPEHPKRITTFDEIDQSYWQLRGMLVRADILAY